MGRRAASLLLVATGLYLGISLGAQKAFGLPAASCTGEKVPSERMPAITVLTTEDAEDKAVKIVTATNTLPDAEVSVEAIKSYYWWEGKVNFDPEWRVAVTTTASFDEVKDIISKVHSYDLPMIIFDFADAPADHRYWKGTIQLSADDAIKLAEKLVEQRIVACAQASPSGLLAVKTVANCKALVDGKSSEAVSWSPISGNQGYLDWMEEECVGGK